MLQIIKISIVLIFLAAFNATAISAQATIQPANEDLQKRIAEMEAEMKRMREELVKLRQSLPVDQPTAQPLAATNDSTVTAKSEMSAEVKREAAKSEIKPETKNNQPVTANRQNSSLGVDIGSVRLTPYGTIFSTLSATAAARTTLTFRFSPRRRAREMRAFAKRLDWEKTSVTVGQDWIVFAPLNPTSIAGAAIPQMAAAGNPMGKIAAS